MVILQPTNVFSSGTLSPISIPAHKSEWPTMTLGHLQGHQNMGQHLPLGEQTTESVPSSRLLQPCREQAWEWSTGYISALTCPSVPHLCTVHNIHNCIQQPHVPPGVAGSHCIITHTWFSKPALQQNMHKSTIHLTVFMELYSQGAKIILKSLWSLMFFLLY